MAKYEFTGETKVEFGVTLKQIRAVAAFGAIAAGAIGGWIASEANLSHDGDAWVSGNAWVYGNAWVSGDARVSGNAWVYGNAWVSGDARVSPIHIMGLRYNVTIADQQMTIGCELHTIIEWEAFDDARITSMDHGALEWWQAHKAPLFAIIKASGRPFAAKND